MDGTGKGMTMDASPKLSFAVENLGRCRNVECLQSFLAVSPSLLLADRLRWRYPLDLAGADEDEGWSIVLSGITPKTISQWKWKE